MTSYTAPPPIEDDYCDAQCLTCDGEGILLVCPDDLCQGQGWCMHGDGEIVCPDCHGAEYMEAKP
jgi:hypothetical protein